MGRAKDKVDCTGNSVTRSMGKKGISWINMRILTRMGPRDRRLRFAASRANHNSLQQPLRFIAAKLYQLCLGHESFVL
jgi:hypothetical protein